jgi:hypothetical protein
VLGRFLACSALLLNGCALLLSEGGGDGDGDSDGGVDTDGGGCGLASRFLDVCAVPEGDSIPAITGALAIDTDTGALSDGSGQVGTFGEMVGNAWAIRVADTISIDMKWRATGSLPLVLIARDVVIGGELDVSSEGLNDGEGTAGAGANLRCKDGRGDNGPVGAGAGGGGLAGSGGAGGVGPGSLGGLGGESIELEGLSLQGGCPGGTGPPADKGGPAPGGLGGGAVLLVAGSIELTPGARVRANGTGGRGGSPGTTAGGGGGGGSGGFIGLEAPLITLTGGSVLVVNGGGGGSGGETGASNNGDSGADGGDDLARAEGGTMPNLGGSGGAAGGLDGTSGEAGTLGVGGAGGGGGAGFVIYRGALNDGGAIVSPEPSDLE